MLRSQKQRPQHDGEATPNIFKISCRRSICLGIVGVIVNADGGSQQGGGDAVMRSGDCWAATGRRHLDPWPAAAPIGRCVNVSGRSIA